MPLDTFFKGPYYNRRLKLQLNEKPLISKLALVDLWVCRWRWRPGDDGRRQVMGFGATPHLAYVHWKFKVLTQC